MIIKNARRTAVALALVAFGAVTAQAQTATQVVNFAVNAINLIAVTGGPQTLTITTATVGSAPTPATASVTWGVTTNQSTAKITGSLSPAMPGGLTLSANLVQPAGGTSLGLKALGTVAVDLVTNVTKVANLGLGLTYQLDATLAAGVVIGGSTTVTYTITGGV
jgi:hypothetical protein